MICDDDDHGDDGNFTEDDGLDAGGHRAVADDDNQYYDYDSFRISRTPRLKRMLSI